MRSLAFAKIFSIWSIGIVLLLLATFIQGLFNSNQFSSDTIFRLFLFISTYGIYYWIITSLTIFLSIGLKNSTASLASTIAIWVFWTIFLPKITGNAVEKLTPLPSRVEFQKAMDEDRSKGIDGHNPSGDREKELEKATLAPTIQDSVGNALDGNADGMAGDAYQHDFSIGQPPAGYQIEHSGAGPQAPLPQLSESDPAGSGLAMGRALGRLDPAYVNDYSDVDYWRIELEQGDRISVSVDSPASVLYPWIWLNDEVGTNVTWDTASGYGPDVTLLSATIRQRAKVSTCSWCPSTPVLASTAAPTSCTSSARAGY